MKKESLYRVMLIFLLIASSTIFAGCISRSPQEGYYEGWNGGISGVDKSMELAIPEEMAYQERLGSEMIDYADRMVIRTANLNIEVDNFDSSFNDILKIVEEHDGFIQDSSSYITSSGGKSGYVTVRVPEDEFLDVIMAFEELGKVESKSIAGEDVTEEYIDLQARLNNSRREEERLLAILDMAEDVEDVLAVERELSRVRGETERLKGRINYLEDRVSLSTITVSLHEPTPITHSWGIRDAIRDAVDAFITTVNGLIIFTGFILPFVIIGLIIIGVYKIWRRKK